MNTLHVNLIGRFGNQMFQYAYARALAEQQGAKLHTPRWVGEEIFDLPDATDHSDYNFKEIPTEYYQDQASLIYTRKQVKEWFRFKPEVEYVLKDVYCTRQVAHRRVGDYANLGYVVVSKKSYRDAYSEFGYRLENVHLLTEESNDQVEGLPEFLPHFYVMVHARVLFRGNSSFSWWAATLGNAKVYSPVIEGLEGGKEQDCKFVEGNWPRFANLPFVTDLYLEEG